MEKISCLLNDARRSACGVPVAYDWLSPTRRLTKSSFWILLVFALLICEPVWPWSSSLGLISSNMPFTIQLTAAVETPPNLSDDASNHLTKSVVQRKDVPERAQRSEEEVEVMDSTASHFTQYQHNLNEMFSNPLEERLKNSAIPARKLTSKDVMTRSSSEHPVLVVFTATGCPNSEEALREAQIAQPMIRNFGGSTEVATVDIKTDSELAKRLRAKAAPRLHFYRDGNLETTEYLTYNGTDMTAGEIAHWVLNEEMASARYTTGDQQNLREAAIEGSPVGPVVHAIVRRESQHATLVEKLVERRESLPSRFTLFNIHYVDQQQREQEEFRVYRQQQPYDVGEEPFLSLKAPVWKPEEIVSLLLEAETRKIFYGDAPSARLLAGRVLFSVYVSQAQNLQDIALLLMEFQPKYEKRVAFHIANRTLKMAARSEDLFSHRWGGAVLTGEKSNTSAYQRASGVFREEVPFSQYALSMPFNYFNMKDFFEEWEKGKRELHFRSSRFTYTEEGSPVMELNHLQFLDVLLKEDRPPLGILYYEPGCLDCEEFLLSWRIVAKGFAEDDELKGRLLFGQVDGVANDLIDFDMRSKLPAIAVYPPGPNALDKRTLYAGPPMVDSVGNFMHLMLQPYRDEL